MTEKINGQGLRPADTAEARRSEAARRPGASADAAAPSTARSAETVNLTRSGMLLNRLEEALQAMPSVDAERVAAIKDALASGRYEIDDQTIAHKLLELDRELLG